MSYQTKYDKYSANLLSRFFALIIDGLVLLVPSFILMLPAAYFSLKLTQESKEQFFYLQFSAAIVSILSSFYRPLFFHFKGKTLGMKAMDIRLVNLHYKNPTWGESFKREFFNLLQVWVSALVIVLSVFLFGHEGRGKALVLIVLPWISTVLWIMNSGRIIFTPNRTSLGDCWAKTIMVEELKGHKGTKKDHSGRIKNVLSA